METKTLLLIVNPISGTKSKDKLVPEIERALTDAGYQVTTKYTTAKGDATKMAGEAVRQGVGYVVVCGGDGTVNETARALCGTGVPMGIVPCGSGNGLARHIGLPSDPMASVEAICKERIVDCDYCTANDSKFFCTFGLGFDAAVTKKFSEQGQRGLNTYIKSAIQEFTHYEPRKYQLDINGEIKEVKAYLVACCNASQYGNNAYIAPEASITDGIIDVVILKDASHFETLFAGIDMMTGMLPYNDQVEVIRTPSVTIRQLNAGAAHVDGEPISMPELVDVRCHHGQLRLFVDPERKKFAPIVTPVNYILRDIGIAISKIFKAKKA